MPLLLLLLLLLVLLLVWALVEDTPRNASPAKDKAMTNSRYMLVFISGLLLPQNCSRKYSP